MEALVAKTSSPDLMVEAERLMHVIACAQGALMTVVGEIDRREAWRSEGRTSCGAWITERFGTSETSGRVIAVVAKKLWDFPHLAQGLRVGALSFDKVTAAVGLATPESDASVLRQAQECTVRQLAEMVRRRRQKAAETVSPDADYAQRYVRFNDERNTISAKLPEDLYALAKSALTRRAKARPHDGETLWEHRLADAFMDMCRGNGGDTNGNGGGGYFVVAHTDWSFLRGGSGSAEVEGLGLLSAKAMQRITCDARIALAVDDAFGHTMFEGRSQQRPTGAQRREANRRDRRCRFPGCANSIFTEVHHIVHWARGGATDLPNLVTLCDYHHHTVHEGRWRMEGNANGMLKFYAPSGRIMSSRPSPLWTARRT
jgi:hypothetical protein